MSSERNGGPAYPQIEVAVVTDGNTSQIVPTVYGGMTLRAWMAGTIAAGWRATGFNADSSRLAEAAVQDADAIIAELAKCNA